MSTQTVTRTDVAHKMLSEAVEDYKRLEQSAHRVFEALIKAQAEMRKEGVVVDLEMSPSMAAAFSEYKVQRGR